MSGTQAGRAWGIPITVAAASTRPVQATASSRRSE